MKIATCTVSLDGFGNPKWTDRRLRLLSVVLNKSRELKVDLLCLPGGYLIAKSDSLINEIVDAVCRESKKHKFAIAIGIDRKNKKKWSKNKLLNKMIKKNILPWFAICWSPNEGMPHLWRERSTTSTNQRECSVSVCAERRTLIVANRYVEVLICGEIFNERIRNNLLSRKDDLTAVVDLGHTSAGFRVWAGMKKLAQGGLTVLCSVHAKKHLARKYCYTRRGCESTSVPDETFSGPPRLELKVWSLS